MKPFTKEYKTFNDWMEAHAAQTPYVQKIVREHNLHPSATLSQLRRHPKAIERPVSKVPKAPMYKWGVDSLTGREYEVRSKALRVLSEVRRGGTKLKVAVKKQHTTIKTVKKYTGAIRKVKGKLTVTRKDKIERKMRIYSQCDEHTIYINNSVTASLIGKYFSLVGEFLHEGKSISILDEFKEIKIIDANGKEWELETRPKCLERIEESRPDGEFFTIYVE